MRNDQTESAQWLQTVDGEPDDMAVAPVTLFRMEEMSKGCWWVAVYQGDRRISMFFNSKKRIKVNICEDEIGLERTELNGE